MLSLFWKTQMLQDFRNFLISSIVFDCFNRCIISKWAIRVIFWKLKTIENITKWLEKDVMRIGRLICCFSTLLIIRWSIMCLLNSKTFLHICTTKFQAHTTHISTHFLLKLTFIQYAELFCFQFLIQFNHIVSAHTTSPRYFTVSIIIPSHEISCSHSPTSNFKKNKKENHTYN